uniref:Uncharacterized protein n=1 Tax=Schistosoma japonicum TaxID=6182 RepID=Q5BZA9_SCHJA|nr:unknown [Schistosoma japonicum]
MLLQLQRLYHNVTSFQVIKLSIHTIFYHHLIVQRKILSVQYVLFRHNTI